VPRPLLGMKGLGERVCHRHNSACIGNHAHNTPGTVLRVQGKAVLPLQYAKRGGNTSCEASLRVALWPVWEPVASPGSACVPHSMLPSRRGGRAQPRMRASHTYTHTHAHTHTHTSMCEFLRTS
jgi:hypothetical protein